MKWKVLFSVGNKTYKTKKSVFDNLEEALNYSNEVCKKHVMTQAKKLLHKSYHKIKKSYII